MHNYSFYPQLVLRTPTSSFDTNINFERLSEAIKDRAFMEAVYLASPVLFRAAMDVKDFSLKENQNIAYSLAKYLMRSRTRCTPFGLFAGVGVVNWGSSTNITIGSCSDRHTRLDMDYLCALALYLVKIDCVRQSVSFSPNSSIYLIDDDIRYIEYNYIGGIREHQISSIKNNEYISAVLSIARSGANMQEIVSTIASEEISEDEAFSFVNELIDCQLLISELDPAITGAEFLSQILSVLNQVRLKDPQLVSILDKLYKTEALLLKLDNSLANGTDFYLQIIELLKAIGVPFDESKLFQVDKNIVTSSSTIDSKFQLGILNAIKQLSPLSGDLQRPNISNFIARFYDRYEDEEVSLLHALDTEMGVGYLDNIAGDFTPLIDGVRLTETQGIDKISWTENQKKIFRLLNRTYINKKYEVMFSEFGFEESNVKPDLCASSSVMFRIVNEKQIVLENVGGSSAANLIGRFAHAHAGIKAMVIDIAQQEQDLNNEVVFAEIVHLPESRIGNILLRPGFRDYEIPFLANSSKDIDHQFLLKDIFISVRHNKIFLRHKPSNTLIVPRLGSAHNFTYNALPVYQFLCDLQTQNFQAGVGFSWGGIGKEFTFLPRVVLDNVILSPAMWQFNHRQILRICKLESVEDILKWRNEESLPSTFLFTEGDNELFIDTSNCVLFDIFKSAIKNKTWVVLKESFLNNAMPTKNAQGEHVANQFVAALIRNEPVYTNLNLELNNEEIKRNFSIGSEWLYLKFYCGAKSADNILQNGIKRVVEKAQSEKWIYKWFFIRYTDPNSHIRVRFHLTNSSHLQSIVDLVKLYVKPFEGIWKIQTDTYKRELERYGYNTISQAETIFYLDSTAYLDFLEATDGDFREGTKWLWGLRSIDKLLNIFGYSLQNKKNLVESIRNGFAAEFRMNQDLKSQLDKKYRENKKEIGEFLENSDNYLDEIWDSRMGVLEKTANEIGTLNPKVDQLLASFIHMHINRLVSSNQRLHELLMYDFLLRNYISQIARQKKQTVTA
jgi:lantibiotic biosynthesis protein